jgi:Outer membrane protein beta-barrel domain
MKKNGLFLPFLRAAAAVLAVISLPRNAAAGEFELYGSYGITFPFYTQTFTWDPGPVSLPIPGLSINQEGTFKLDAQGSSTWGIGGTFYFASAFGLEVRGDFASADITTTGATYTVRLTLPPFPPINTDLDLGTGAVDVDRLTPISFNLKFHTPGRFALGVSGGVSYLPSFKITARQNIALGVSALNVGNQELEVSTLPFAAVVQPTAESQSKWGFNGGIILRIPFNAKVALVGDARYFRFSEQTVTWGRADSRPLNNIEQLLLAQVQQRLDPLTFRPEWFQVTGGLAITF